MTPELMLCDFEFSIIIVLVFVFAFIQSIFGVGLLIFGTPTLLLLGYPFDRTLACLLPGSIVINLLQVSGSWKQIQLKNELAAYCLPFVIVGLSGVLYYGRSLDIRPLVGIFMLVTAVARSSALAREFSREHGRRFIKPILVGIGIIHGLTNMGGGLLSIFAGIIESEKEKIRSTIACGYLMMACSQLVVLILIKHRQMGWESAVLAMVAGAPFLLIGDRVFRFSTEGYYQRAITVFMAAFGGILVFG